MIQATRVICLFLPLMLFGQNKPIHSIEVSNVEVGRTHSQQPQMTIVYQDGTTGTGIFTLQHQSGNGVQFQNNQFSRSPNTPDQDIVCTWEYQGHRTQSTVRVRGQIDQIEVTDGQVGRTTTFTPTVTRYYTDGTIETDTRADLVQATPSDLVNVQQTADGQQISRNPNVPDGAVAITWEWTDGVTATATSTVDVKGQIDRIEVSDGEVGPGETFTPAIRILYTDGSIESQGPVQMESISPEGIVHHQANSNMGTHTFSHNNQGREGVAACNWSKTDGVTAKTASTVTATMRPKPARTQCGVEFRPGYSTYQLDDLKTSQSTIKAVNELSGTEASAETFNGGFSPALSLFMNYSLPNNHKIGVGLGYQHLGGGTYEQNESFHGSTYDWNLMFELNISTYSIPLELFYIMPVTLFNSPFWLKIGSSLAYYSVNMKLDYESVYQDESGENLTDTVKGKFKDNKISPSIKVGLEYILNKNWTLKFLLGYAWARLSGFDGTLTTPCGEKVKALLIMKQTDQGELIGTQYKSDTLSENNRRAVIDLSGIHIMFGIHYNLPCCILKN